MEPHEYAVLVAEANVVPRATRERVCEIMFEKLRVPALFLAKNAVGAQAFKSIVLLVRTACMLLCYFATGSH